MMCSKLRKSALALYSCLSRCRHFSRPETLTFAPHVHIFANAHIGDLRHYEHIVLQALGVLPQKRFLTTVVFQVPLLVLSKTIKYLCVTLDTLVQVETCLNACLSVLSLGQCCNRLSQCVIVQCCAGHQRVSGQNADAELQYTALHSCSH